MKYKIGIFGSSAGDLENILPKARQLGRALGKHADAISIITGACSGLPYAVAKAAADEGSEILGFSPVFDIEEQKKFTPDDDISIYKRIEYMPRNFKLANNDLANKKYRNVISTATCDAGIVISGRWGSLNEFTNLIDMQKIVGVLTGTNGIADELPGLSQKISKEGQGQIIFNDNPVKLVEEVLAALQNRPAIKPAK